ncbi:MAG: SPFH domain-containing protein [Bifidobacterium sp.]|nr:SPFH domain-containing protein [Bifidobacterium sp.]
MVVFKKNSNEMMYEGGKKHFVDVIKNRAPNDTFIFKNPEEDFNNGSTLVVEPGEQAVFVNEGNIEQTFNQGTYTLSPQNYPFISRLRNALSGGVSSFHCLVYFVRIASGHEIKWGTPEPIKVYDKSLADQFTGIGVETEIRARGAYRVKVVDAGMLLTNMVGGNYDLTSQESLRDFFRNEFLESITSTLTQEFNAFNGPLNALPGNAGQYSSEIQQQLAPKVAQYGLQMLKFSIAAIEVVDNDQRREAQDLASENRRNYYGSMAAGAGNAAFAQGQQQAYQTYGTDYQQAQVLKAMNKTADNPGAAGSSLMNAGLGLTMGAGLGQALPNVFNSTMQAAQGPASNQNGQNGQNQGQGQNQTVPHGQPDGNGPSENSQSQGVPAPDVPQPPAPANPSNASADGPTMFERLSQLKQMLDAGLITQDEYDTKKSEILKSL